MCVRPTLCPPNSSFGKPWTANAGGVYDVGCGIEQVREPFQKPIESLGQVVDALSREFPQLLATPKQTLEIWAY